jgi:hypothetical protein
MDLDFLPDQETEEDDERFGKSLFTEKEINKIVEKEFSKIMHGHARDLMRDIF